MNRKIQYIEFDEALVFIGMVLNDAFNGSFGIIYFSFSNISISKHSKSLVMGIVPPNTTINISLKV